MFRMFLGECVIITTKTKLNDNNNKDKHHEGNKQADNKY